MLPRASQLESFTDVFVDEIAQENISQPISWPSSCDSVPESPIKVSATKKTKYSRPLKYTGQHGEFRSIEEIDPKFRCLFTYPYFNLVQSRIIEDALYSDKSFVLCAPTGSGKTVAFELAILQLLMQIEDTGHNGDFKIIYMAPVKAVCNERLTEWYPKLTRLGLLCIEVTGDTEVDFTQLKPYKVIITTPEKWDMLTRRWRDHRGLVEMIKLFLIDEVHILNDETRGPVLEAVVSRMKTVESAAQSAHRIEQLQQQYQGSSTATEAPPRIRFVAVSATVSNPEDVADWLGTSEKPAVFYKFGDECRPVKLRRVVEGYPCGEGTSIFKFDIILNYKLWAIIQKYYNGKPTLIFCNTRKSVTMTAEALSREITVSFDPEQKAKLTALASTLKNKKLQMLVMSGVGCHHAGLLYEERVNIEQAFRNRDLPILITTTTLAMGVNLPAHLVIIKNTQQYVNGAYQEYSISTVLQMVGRAGRPQFDTEATAVIMTRLNDKARYQSLVGGSEPLQSYLHKRLAENLNSEAALGTVTDVAQCVEWLRSTFLYVRAAKDPRRYLGLPPAAPMSLILKKIEAIACQYLEVHCVVTIALASNVKAKSSVYFYWLAFAVPRTERFQGTPITLNYPLFGRGGGCIGLKAKRVNTDSLSTEDALSLSSCELFVDDTTSKTVKEHNRKIEIDFIYLYPESNLKLFEKWDSFQIKATKIMEADVGLSADLKSQLKEDDEKLCVKAMNGLASSGLITMDEACCIESTEAGRLMSVFYLDVETMKNIMKIEGTETLEQILRLVCESHELSDMHLRMDERRCLNLLNRNNAAPTIRFPMKGKISTRQMKLNCIIQAVLGCLVIPEPALNQEAMKVMRIASRVCTCLVRYVTRPDTTQQSQYSAVLNSIVLAKCVEAHLWENSPYVSRQLKGIGPTFSTLLASAGLTSFMLLEESHPRDLERIMNKGPPAGNVLRKQVSLLPKYQLTATPIDNQTISVQLMLLNHAYLSENIDHLTAGDNHKSYLIVGDSENHLLLLKPFTDKDLISVYDGTMTFEIRRKHINEHTVVINCISSQIAGIDAHAEYFFQDLGPPTRCEGDSFLCPNQEPPKKNIAKKQTNITDVYKQKKRPNTSPNKITQCKEKIKRDNALTQKLKALKESFGRTSKELKKDMDKSTKMSSELLSDLLDNHGTPNSARQAQNLQETEVDCPPTVDLTNNIINASWEDINIIDEEDDYIDDVQIDNILNNIENEITGNHHGGFQDIAVRTMPCVNYNVDTLQPTEKCGPKNINHKSNDFIEPACSKFGKDFRKRKNIQTKSNFSVVDLIEKKAKTDISDHVDLQNSDNRFSETIKCHINKFLGRANDSKLRSREMDDLLYMSNDTELPEVHVKAPQTADNKEKIQDNTTKSDNAPVNDDEIKITKLNTSVGTNSHNIRYEVIPTYSAENNAAIQHMTSNTDGNMETHEQLYKTNEDTLPAVHVKNHKTIQKNTNVKYNINTRTDKPSAINNNRFEISSNKESKDMNSELKVTDIDHDKSDESYIMAADNNALVQNGDTRITNAYSENPSDTKLYSVETNKRLNSEITELHVPSNQTTHNNLKTQSITSTKLCKAPNKNNSSGNNTQGCNQSEYIKLNSEMDFSKKYRLNELREITEINQNVNTTNNDHIDNNENTLVPFLKPYIWPKVSVNCLQQRIYQANTPAMSLIPQLRTPASIIPHYIAMPDRLIGIRSKEVTRYKPPTANENLEVNSHQHPEHHSNNMSDKTLFNNKLVTYSQNEIPQQQDTYHSIILHSSLDSIEKAHVNRNAILNNSKSITYSQNETENNLQNICNSKRINPCFDKNETTKTHVIDDTSLNKDKSITYPQNEIVKQLQNSSNTARFVPCFGKKGKTHVNRYSYTATKVDVHTKDALDHQLRITRKLKVDVDITEIVTQEKTKIHKENPKNENLEPTPNISNDYISHTQNDEIDIRNVEMEMSENERKLSIKEKAEDITRNANEHPPREECNVEDKPINSISMNCINQSSNNITNILQKYSKILSKPEIRSTPIMNNTNNDSGYSTSASKTIGSQSSTVKTRRPFRIKDIHTADLPLPDAIIEANTTATPIQPRKKLETLKVEIKNESEVASQNIELEQPHEYDYNIPNHNINEKSPFNELPIADQSLDLDPAENLEDENMLNPKMLLQYFSTDSNEPELPTDIVAPPAEFSDSPAIYSPSTPTQMESPSFYDTQNPVNQYSEEETLDHFNYSDNLYTPRALPEAVETWCLSREDERDNFKSRQSSAPWIGSPRAGSSQMSSGAGSSRNRLGHFKFVRKKQLRP